MNETPLTDKRFREIYDACQRHDGHKDWMAFAAQLERDLAAAQKERDELKAKLQELCGVDNYLLATENDKLKAKLDSAKKWIRAIRQKYEDVYRASDFFLSVDEDAAAKAITEDGT